LVSRADISDMDGIASLRIVMWTGTGLYEKTVVFTAQLRTQG